VPSALLSMVCIGPFATFLLSLYLYYTASI